MCLEFILDTSMEAMQITKHLVSYYFMLFLRVEIHSLVQNQDCDIYDYKVI